jgi:hypothetical protein
LNLNLLVLKAEFALHEMVERAPLGSGPLQDVVPEPVAASFLKQLLEREAGLVVVVLAAVPDEHVVLAAVPDVLAVRVGLAFAVRDGLAFAVRVGLAFAVRVGLAFAVADIRDAAAVAWLQYPQ